MTLDKVLAALTIVAIIAGAGMTYQAMANDVNDTAKNLEQLSNETIKIQENLGSLVNQHEKEALIEKNKRLKKKLSALQGGETPPGNP